MSNNNAVVIQYLETLRGICSLLEKISYDETGTCVDDVIEALKQSLAQPVPYPHCNGKCALGNMADPQCCHTIVYPSMPSQPQAPVVPEGWRLVPIKLDVFMALFLTSLKHREKVSAQKMWDEILSVVPTPTPEPAQRDERAELLARAERAEGLIERIKEQAMNKHELPELPKPNRTSYEGIGNQDGIRLYTADQMREYALAAMQASVGEYCLEIDKQIAALKQSLVQPLQLLQK